MNILLTNQEGLQAQGMKLLRDAVKIVFKDARIITIAPAAPMTGSSFSSLHPQMGPDGFGALAETMEEVEPNVYVVDLGPADIIDLAHLEWERFLVRNAWDLVFTGVTHTPTLGTDVLRSGATCAAVLAASAYGTAAATFAAQMNQGAFTLQQEKLLTDMLRSHRPAPGECYAANIPLQVNPGGYRAVPIAHYSYSRTPPVKIVPRAKEEKSDVTEFKKGFVTISRLALRLNANLAY